MVKYSAQKGFGLMEVLVALVLLAVAVLGFSVLQVRGMDASQEASDRTAAMNVARDLAERIRINRNGLATYKQAINGDVNVAGCVGTAQSYLPNCSSTRMAQFDATEVLAKAELLGQTLVIDDCVGSNLQCIYVAWGETEIAEGDLDSCIDPEVRNGDGDILDAGGVYVVDSRCLVIEAFPL